MLKTCFICENYLGNTQLIRGINIQEIIYEENKVFRLRPGYSLHDLLSIDGKIFKCFSQGLYKIFENFNTVVSKNIESLR